MNQRSIKMYKWKDLKTIHNQIYNKNNVLTPYQSYEFLSEIKLGKNDRNPFETIGYKEQNFVLFDENMHPIAIAPFYSKKKNGKYNILFRGHISSTGHLDFIYKSNFSYDDYVYMMNEIKKYYKSGTINFDRISENSLVYKYALKEKKYHMEGSVLVTIKLPGEYEEWFSSLRKSVRQNIRTAYNRMKKDKKEYKYELYYKNAPQGKVEEDIVKLFSRRLCDHSKINSKIVEKVLYLLKRKNPMTLGIINNPEYIGATLYIDDVLVAYFEGFVSNDNRILVPRLSINVDYGRYSPGGILINETMKKIIKEKNISEFDLQRGNEPYKYSYGGIEYLNYEWLFEF